jgi:hypothetical protein
MFSPFSFYKSYFFELCRQTHSKDCFAYIVNQTKQHNRSENETVILIT